jgi:hypothetical protein
MDTLHRGSLVRLILAAVLAGGLLPQLVLTGGGLSVTALVGSCTIGFVGGLLIDSWRWLALIPSAASIGVAVGYLATIDLSPFGVNAGIPRGSIYAFIAIVAATHAIAAMTAAMGGAVAARRFG